MKDTYIKQKCDLKLEVPKDWVKKRSDICIVCGHDPKTREKRECGAYGSVVNKGRHQYIYPAPPQEDLKETI